MGHTTPIKMYREGIIHDIYDTLLEKGYKPAADGRITAKIDANITYVDERDVYYIVLVKIVARNNSFVVKGDNYRDNDGEFTYDYTNISTDDLYEILDAVEHINNRRA